VFNVDFRYSRYIPLGTPTAELFIEGKNLFNRENLSAVNRVVATDALGNPVAPISIHGADYPLTGKAGYDQRILQIGFKVAF
jgi:hypothetical protein